MQISLTISAPSSSRYLHHFSDPSPHSISQKPPPSPFSQPLPAIQFAVRNLSLGQQLSRVHSVKGSGFFSAIGRAIEEEEYRKARSEVLRKGFELEGYSIEGISIGGHETCVIIPELKAAFDIGRCPLRAVHQNFVFITHGHLDHIGGLPMYVATRALYSLKPPTIFVPPCIEEDIERLFDIHRSMGQVDLNFDLVALDIGETYELRNDLVVRPFRTHHVIQSQGYVVYSIRKKLKKQYIHLNGKQIEKLKKSGVEITDMILSPEVAFTGDTTSDFMLEPRNADALRAKLLITEATFLDDGFSIGDARERGHTHLFEERIAVVGLIAIGASKAQWTAKCLSGGLPDHESQYRLYVEEVLSFALIENAHWIRNRAVLLTHFSSRYHLEDIRKAVSKLQAKVSAKVASLTEGFRSTYL